MSLASLGYNEAQVTIDALNDPRPGDVFHEMYSFGAEVLDVRVDTVYWRTFNTAEIERGECTREEWSKKFLYGGTSSVADRAWVRLSRRGEW